METNNLIFEKAIYIRLLETFLLELFSTGRLNGTVHTCVGQELIPVIIARHLTETDFIFSNHRGHGHYLSVDGDPNQLILELLGSPAGISKGIGGSQHIFTKSFISNGIQGGMAPIAAGYSGSDLHDKSIAVCFIGDGTLGEGQFYEAIILSKIFNSRLLIVLENNHYAQSTPSDLTIFGDLKNRFEGFGLKFFKTNIWDIDSLNYTSSQAINSARQDSPTILEVDCYRLNSHSKGDDNRDQSEINEFHKKDLINQYIARHAEWYEDFKAKTLSGFNDLINNIPNIDFDYSWLENKSLINRPLKWMPWQQPIDFEGKRTNEIINKALQNLIKKFDALIIGEDIIDTTNQTPHEYGGAFKVTKGLSTQHPSNLKNTSISEAGILGFGIGSALKGRSTIVEIMFGDFITLCMDQLIQQASKIPTMYGQKISLPLIVRTPMGGRRGYGPTHSQNLERLVLFLPNINVIALNILNDPCKIYESILDNNLGTTIVIEDKVSYTTIIKDITIKGYLIEQSDELFPVFRIKPTFTNPNCTIVTYGSMLNEVLEVVKDLFEEEIFPEIISPTMLSPLNKNIYEHIYNSTQQIIFIEEGSKLASWSAEFIASYFEGGYRPKKVKRISNESIIPCTKEIEDQIIPSRLNLFKKILDVFYQS